MNYTEPSDPQDQPNPYTWFLVMERKFAVALDFIQTLAGFDCDFYTKGLSKKDKYCVCDSCKARATVAHIEAVK